MVGAGVAEGTDGIRIDGVGKDLQVGRLNSGLPGEVGGHSFGLAYDFVG
jgi:hypothetical protein